MKVFFKMAFLCFACIVIPLQMSSCQSEAKETSDSVLLENAKQVLMQDADAMEWVRLNRYVDDKLFNDPSYFNMGKANVAQSAQKTSAYLATIKGTKFNEDDVYKNLARIREESGVNHAQEKMDITRKTSTLLLGLSKKYPQYKTPMGNATLLIKALYSLKGTTKVNTPVVPQSFYDEAKARRAKSKS